jgi:ribonucleoside-diphosphate reductase alpha chain
MNKLLEYYNGDEFAANVWKNKYAAKGEETPDDMHRRLAREFAKIRAKKDPSLGEADWAEHFYELFKDFQSVIPQGRIMAGLGVDESYRSLSNCLRLPPPKDSYSSIMYVDTMMVSAAKRGCGYGVGLSNLRPYSASTTNAANTSTGVTTFGNRYSNSTHEVGQQGRRGACLEDLDIRHPESDNWAVVKLDKTKLTGANISFKMWNDFMKAVVDDEDYILRWPVDKELNIAYPDPKQLPYNKLLTVNSDKEDGVRYIKKVKARELWNKSIHGVWADGCPGLQFWERIVNYDPASVYKKYEIDGTNACGEQPKAIFDTCRLLAENLFGVVDSPFTDKAVINYERLYKQSYEQLVLGDDLVDLECIYVQRIIDKVLSDPEPLEEKQIELTLWRNVLDMAKSGRRVGCGITGLGDMLAAVGLKYDSDEALKLVDKVMFIKMQAELTASIDLAEKYGPFKGWDASLEYELTEDGYPISGKNEFYDFLLETYPELVERMCKVGRRNVNWSTIAPTGTLSIVAKAVKYANISSGCEPQFGLYFFRNKKAQDSEPYDFIDEVGIKWKTYPVVMGAFKDWFEIYKVNSKNLKDKQIEDLSKDEIDALYELSPWYGSTANDIDWGKRVEMQAILQKYTTSAISSTINLPNDVKEEVISDLYMQAWKAGLKGITCYRDGSKGGVLVKEKKTDSFDYQDAAKRPKKLEADLHITTAKGKKYAVIVGLFNQKPYEIFAFEASSEISKVGKLKGEVVKAKKGHYNFTNGQSDHAIKDIHVIAEKGQEQMLTRLISGMLRHGAKPQFVMEQIDKCELDVIEFGSAIKRVLKKYVNEDELVARATCADCGSTDLKMQEGCLTCNSCGSSKCG